MSDVYIKRYPKTKRQLAEDLGAILADALADYYDSGEVDTGTTTKAAIFDDGDATATLAQIRGGVLVAADTGKAQVITLPTPTADDDGLVVQLINLDATGATTVATEGSETAPSIGTLDAANDYSVFYWDNSATQWNVIYESIA